MIVMNSTEFVAKCKQIAANYNTVYGKGTFGQPVTNSFINGKLNQYYSWYKPRESFFRSLVGKNYFAFDCVGLVKGVLWGWSGNPNASHGGATYTKYGIPDVDESGMLKLCTNVTTNFSNIPVGAFLWVSGHCGVYIGNKQAIECTPKWSNKVQVTNVANLGNTSGNSRTWTKWGKLPYINYVSANPYEYNGVDYSPVFDPNYYLNKYADLKKAFGTNKEKAFNHFTTYGMKEQRQANAAFNVNYYKANYADLQKAFKDDYPAYYKHYCVYGKKEKRVADKLLKNSKLDTNITKTFETIDQTKKISHQGSKTANYKSDKYNKKYKSNNVVYMYDGINTNNKISAIPKLDEITCYGYYDYDDNLDIWLYCTATVNKKVITGFIKLSSI